MKKWLLGVLVLAMFVPVGFGAHTGPEIVVEDFEDDPTGGADPSESWYTYGEGAGSSITTLGSGGNPGKALRQGTTAFNDDHWFMDTVNLCGINEFKIDVKGGWNDGHFVGLMDKSSMAGTGEVVNNGGTRSEGFGLFENHDGNLWAYASGDSTGAALTNLGAKPASSTWITVTIDNIDCGSASARIGRSDGGSATVTHVGSIPHLDRITGTRYTGSSNQVTNMDHDNILVDSLNVAQPHNDAPTASYTAFSKQPMGLAVQGNPDQPRVYVKEEGGLVYEFNYQLAVVSTTDACPAGVTRAGNSVSGAVMTDVGSSLQWMDISNDGQVAYSGCNHSTLSQHRVAVAGPPATTQTGSWEFRYGDPTSGPINYVAIGTDDPWPLGLAVATNAKAGVQHTGGLAEVTFSTLGVGMDHIHGDRIYAAGNDGLRVFNTVGQALQSYNIASNAVDAYNHFVYLGRGVSGLEKYNLTTLPASISPVATSAAALTNAMGVQVSWDGDYVLTWSDTATARISLLNSTDLSELVRIEPGASIYDAQMDPANNYVFATLSDGSVARFDVFDYTSSAAGDGGAGNPNPTPTNLTGVPDSGAAPATPTAASEGESGQRVEGEPTFPGVDMDSLSTALGVSLDATGWFLGLMFAGAITMVFFAMGGSKVAVVGAVIGVGMSTAFGLFPLWFIVFLFMIAAAIVVLFLRRG